MSTMQEKLKKCICVMLVVSMLVGLVSVAASAQSQPSSWADESVGIAVWNGLVPPHLQSNFTQAITRAEFAALAVSLYENRNGLITGRVFFDDTQDDAVEKAAYIGIVQGVGNNRFNPNNNITRQEAAVLLTRVAGAIGAPLPRIVPTFYDFNSIAYWARESVGRVQPAEIMLGVGDNIFNPHGSFTREQSIIAMLRVYTFAWGSPLDNLVNVEGWEIEDWLSHDGWVIDFWGETSGNTPNFPINLDMVPVSAFQSGVGFNAVSGGTQQSLTNMALTNVSSGGETRIRRINHGRFAGSTYEIFLSDSNVQRLLTGFNIANVASKVADVYSLFTSGIPTYEEQISSSVKKKLSSFVVTVLGSELDRVSRHSNGYGIIITTRVGAVYFVNEKIPVRSQFDRAINPISFMVSHESIPTWSFPNAPTPNGNLTRGTVVNAIGSRFDASHEGAIWWLLDTGVWVHGAVLSQVGRTRIITTEYPLQDGRRTRGGGDILIGQEASLTATPASGWEFVGWYENGNHVYNNTTYVFNVTMNPRTLEARFRLSGDSTQTPPITNERFFLYDSGQGLIFYLSEAPVNIVRDNSLQGVAVGDGIERITVRAGTAILVEDRWDGNRHGSIHASDEWNDFTNPPLDGWVRVDNYTHKFIFNARGTLYLEAWMRALFWEINIV